MWAYLLGTLGRMHEFKPILPEDVSITPKRRTSDYPRRLGRELTKEIFLLGVSTFQMDVLCVVLILPVLRLLSQQLELWISNSSKSSQLKKDSVGRHFPIGFSHETAPPVGLISSKKT